MSAKLSPYLGMPIYGHIVVINPYDQIKHWRSIHKDDYVTSPFRARRLLPLGSVLLVIISFIFIALFKNKFTVLRIHKKHIMFLFQFSSYSSLWEYCGGAFHVLLSWMQENNDNSSKSYVLSCIVA